MKKTMLIDAAHPEEVRVCVLENGAVEDFDFESATRKPLRGNIYLARVTRVEPSLQAAFIEYGGNRHGFLAFNEIHPDYYQIPVSDRRLLQEAEAEEAALAAELELDQRGDEDAEDEFDLSPGAGPGDEDAPDFRDGGEDPQAASDDDARDIEDDAPEPESVSKAYESPESAAESPEDAFSENGEDLVEHIPSDPAGKAPAGKQKRSPRRGELIERYKEARRKHARLVRNYKIQEVVKRRQILLVQVVKEERGNKGAALTTYLSLAGRYCVLMPNTARGGGISRKIPVAADRKRLRRVVDSLDVPQGVGLIIRTAGAKRTKAEIKRDYDYLIRLWENIRTLTLNSIAPCLIYEEANLIKRAIRDLYDKDIDAILVEGDVSYREAKDFMKMLMPSHAKNVQPYKEKTPLFLKYGVESQLDAMYQPTVRLKSGGYIVIHQTEALVAIDVNSGKSTRERNIELTALKTNSEAAKEAARQCRLRDLAGLIVIDFIDMEENKNNRAVEKRLKDALKSDRARLQVGRISNFGLLEMSRQRRRSGIVDGTTHSCPTCGGAGAVRSNEMASLRILRAIEAQAIQGRAAVIAVKASSDVALYILNQKRAWLKRIEDDYALSIEIIVDDTKAGDQYEVEKRGAARDLPEAPAVIRADGPDLEKDSDIEDNLEAEVSDDEGDAATPSETRADGEGGARRKRRRRRRRRDEPNGPQQAKDDSDGQPAVHEDGEAAPERNAGEASENVESESQKKRRRRGRRGGRRNNRRPEQTDPETAPADEAENLAGQPSDHTDVQPVDIEPEEYSAQYEPAPAPDAGDAEQRAAASLQALHKEEDAGSPEDAANGDPKSTRKGWWRRAIGG